MNWISTIGYSMFPLSDSGNAGTLRDIIHIYVVTVLVVLLSIASLVTIMIGGFLPPKIVKEFRGCCNIMQRVLCSHKMFSMLIHSFVLLSLRDNLPQMSSCMDNHSVRCYRPCHKWWVNHSKTMRLLRRRREVPSTYFILVSSSWQYFHVIFSLTCKKVLWTPCLKLMYGVFLPLSSSITPSSRFTSGTGVCPVQSFNYYYSILFVFFNQSIEIKEWWDDN